LYKWFETAGRFFLSYRMRKTFHQWEYKDKNSQEKCQIKKFFKDFYSFHGFRENQFTKHPLKNN
jgi:hypothetical protein